MSKMRLFKEAERLYLDEKLTPGEIAMQLDISRRTIFYWKKKYEWDKHLHKKYKSEELFSVELLELARSFMRKLSNDLDNINNGTGYKTKNNKAAKTAYISQT